MRMLWVLRGALLGVLATLLLRYLHSAARPLLEHADFELSTRQNNAAQALVDRGARFCCGEHDCRQMKSELGPFATRVPCTNIKRTPHCGVGDGLLVDGTFRRGPFTLRDLEKIIA